MNPLKTRALTRQQIGQFVSSERGIRAFEDVQADIAAQYEAITDASFLTLTTEPGLGSERVFTPTSDFSVTDGGPNSTYGFSLSATGVVAGPYGDASHVISITVDSRGRLSSATAYAINTDNITEGSTNLFFTNARARAALSGGTGVDYNSTTGQIAVAANGVSDALLRQSAAFSVIGRATNTTGNVADITAASDGQVLRRSGSTMGFGAIDLSSSGAVAGLLTVARGGTGAGSYTANKYLKGNGTSALASASVTDTGALVSIDSGVGFSIARTGVTSPVSNDGNVYSGTYTPTLTSVANVDSSAAYPCGYKRVGNEVTVRGRLDIDCTTAGTFTRLGISLPIASNIGNDYECGGTANAIATASMSGGIRGDPVNDRAELSLVPTVATAQGMFFIFQYQVI